MRGNTRAVPLALAYMRSLELRGARVLNGADVFALELSKSAQATLLRDARHRLPALDHLQRRRRAASDTADDISWPALLKPDQGGSGARIQVVESLEHVEAIFRRDPAVWLPDNLFLLQELLPHDPEQGIVRLEFLGGELLYAMRVKTHGRFNLCPSPVCNPEEGDGTCEVPVARRAGAAGRVLPVPGRAAEAVETAHAHRAGGAGSTSAASSISRPTTAGASSTTSTRTRTCGRRSAAAFGFDPFERVVDFLVRISEVPPRRHEAHEGAQP